MNVGDVTGPRWVSGDVDEAAFRESSARLSGALSGVARERDEALKALGESRQRFGDSETKRAELEAALDAVRKLAIGPTPTVDEWWPLLRSIAAAASAVPSVVLQDRDAAVWEQGARAALLSEGYAVVDMAAVLQTNPYRADQYGEQS